MPVLHLRIVGQVQGVGFRWFVRENAVKLGIAGWVRNLPNGDVEVAAQGRDEQLSALEGLVSRGPAGADVTGVARLTPPTTIEYPQQFRIER